MKKCFQLMSFALMLPAAIAAEKEERKPAGDNPSLTSEKLSPSLESLTITDKKNAPAFPNETPNYDPSTISPLSLPGEVSVPTPTRDLPATLSSQSEFEALKSNPNNIENKGGLPGGFFSQPALRDEAVEMQIKYLSDLYNASREHNASLMLQLGIANENLKGMQALHRALESAQKERDEEARARALLQSRVEAAEARATFLKNTEQALLLEANRMDAAMILEKARKEFLERENLALREIIAELAANAKKVESLFAENSDYEKILKTPLSEGTDVEKTHQNIRIVVEENAKKIRELQEKNKILAAQEIETKEKIIKLERAIEANDYYTLMLNKIDDRRVSDEDLALYIWSIRTVLGVDLDQLSEGHDMRLIEVLIGVSMPYEKRPSGYVTCEYYGRFRTLGNQFVPYGLAWVGPSLNYKDCTYLGSKFAQTSAEVASYAKKQLSKK